MFEVKDKRNIIIINKQYHFYVSNKVNVNHSQQCKIIPNYFFVKENNIGISNNDENKNEIQKRTLVYIKVAKILHTNIMYVNW